MDVFLFLIGSLRDSSRSRSFCDKKLPRCGPFLFSFWTGLVSGQALAETFPQPHFHRCAPQVRVLLDRWGASGPWGRVIGRSPGERIFRSPTRELGKWVEVIERPQSSRVILFNSEQRVRVEFASACAPQARVEKLEVTADADRWHGRTEVAGFPILRDPDLKRLLQESKRGVVYLWTPHKYISVDGLREALKASRKAGVPLIPVVEPTSDPEAVRREAKALGLAPEKVFFLDSMDLQYRNFRIHHPSLIVFNEGRWSSQVRRGHEKADIIEEYLRVHAPERARTGSVQKL